MTTKAEKAQAAADRAEDRADQVAEDLAEDRAEAKRLDDAATTVAPPAPAPIELTGHQIAYLASRGYTTDPVGFVTRMGPEDRASFFAGAEAWIEGQPENEDEPAAEPVKQGPIVTGVVHKAP